MMDFGVRKIVEEAPNPIPTRMPETTPETTSTTVPNNTPIYISNNAIKQGRRPKQCKNLTLLVRMN